MFTLEIEYSYYKCLACLLIDNQLSDLYNNTNSCNIVNQLDVNYYDNELEEFLLEFIEKADNNSNGKSVENINLLLLNYTRLPDLVQYIYKVKYLWKKQMKILEDTFLKYPALEDYQLSDSRLTDLFFDNRKNKCIMNLKNVALYGERRNNKNIAVNWGDIKLIFQKTQKVKMKGELYVEEPGANKVYSWHVRRTSDNLLNFCLFILVVHRCFMMEILCSDIDVESLESSLEQYTGI